MKQLFDDEGQYTQDATDIQEDAMRRLLPLARKYYAQGFGIRDISHLLQLAAFDVELEMMLEQNPSYAGSVGQFRTQD